METFTHVFNGCVFMTKRGTIKYADEFDVDWDHPLCVYLHKLGVDVEPSDELERALESITGIEIKLLSTDHTAREIVAVVFDRWYRRIDYPVDDPFVTPPPPIDKRARHICGTLAANFNAATSRVGLTVITGWTN